MRTRSVPTILVVLAHPDDESFMMGGTLAFYTARGVAVYLICATRGEVGTVDPAYLKGINTIAELRENELRCAARCLGLKDVIFLGYRDSGMAGSPNNQHPDAYIRHSVAEVAGRVVKHIRELKPDVVLTFDPIGAYNHPDHIHVHNATVMAFERADDPTFHPEAIPLLKPDALYFRIIPRGFRKVVISVMPLLGMNPRKTGRNRNIDFPIHVSVDIRSVRRIKDSARACHASQGGKQVGRGVTRFLSRLFEAKEYYMRAHPAVPVGVLPRNDLLDLT